MRAWRRLFGALAVLSLVAACGADDPAPPAPAGIQREPAPLVGDLSLPDAGRDEEPMALRGQPGRLLLVYFGYTSCPDVCPTTMADLRLALEDLGERAQRVDLAMVTVDPDRDRPELLTGYVRSFVPTGRALRTTDGAALRRVADAFGADYSVTTDAGGRVEVAHTGSVYVVDDAGRLRLQWPFGTAADDIRLDLDALLATPARTS